MNTQAANKAIQTRDIKQGIGAYQSQKKTEKALNHPMNVYENSDNIPQAIGKLAIDIPEGAVRNLAWKFVKTINSILSKSLFYLGVEIGSSGDDLDAQAKEATKKLKLITYILYKVLDDPDVKENVRQLAIALNDSALQPFLEAALITMDEMHPAIDRASDELAVKWKHGLKKFGDAAVGALEDVIGTTPYIGNFYNAGSAIMNTVQGLQAVADTSAELILETTVRVMLLLKKVEGPGFEAVESFVDFALNAQNTYITVVNKFDKINAQIAHVGDTFNPAIGVSKADLIKKVEEADRKALPTGLPPATAATAAPSTAATAPTTAPTTAPSTAPSIAATAAPATAATAAPAKAQAGGRRRRKKRKTKKRHQKKRTKRKSHRRK